MAAQFASLIELSKGLSSLGTLNDTNFILKDEDKLRGPVIDQLVFTSTFASDEELRDTSRSLIHALASDLDIRSSSVYDLYQAIARGEVSGFTVPAINIRALTYDSARLIFRLAKKHSIGAFVLELARSEMGYTFQDPGEFAASVLAAAIKENYTGPVFLQGDHYQVGANVYKENPETELKKLRSLIEQTLAAQIWNIDIDASTLVDLEKPTVTEQQVENSKVTAELTTFIREHEKDGKTISIGGEIGHIGDRNSNEEDFRSFMEQYLSQISGKGLSKVSVQTGSSHGGSVDASGHVKEVTIDFSVIETIGKFARNEFHMGGAVQHGASTLSLDLYPTFVEKKTLEIHLSTMFQNIIFDKLPVDLRQQMEYWINENFGKDRKPEMSDIQFLYKFRKKAIGPYKKQLWGLSDDEKEPILAALEEEYETIFEKLNVFNTTDTVAKYT